MDFISKEWIYEKNGIEYGDMARIMYTDDSFFGNYDLAERLLNT